MPRPAVRYRLSLDGTIVRCVIVDDLQARSFGGRVERSARLRWVGGEFRLTIDVPEGFQAAGEDATAHMLAALPLALYRGEDLYVDGSVSPLTLRHTERIQSIYAAWDPAVRRCRVRVRGETPMRASAQGHGCLLSRGVDSIYSALYSHDRPLTHLIFCDTLTPCQDTAVREQEVRIVEEMAGIIGLPLLRISTNLRDPDAQMIDYQDMHGAGIAFMAQSLSGGLGRVVVPSGLTYSVAGAAGSHPLLDPLFASEWLELDHHGLELGRPGKIAQIVALRPELLPYIKVCYSEDIADNCGVCRKCLWTMVALQSAGALERASLFPDKIDLHALAEVRLSELLQRLYWMQAAESLGDSEQDRAVREAVMHVLRRSARPSVRERARGTLAWIKGQRERPDLAWSTSSSAQFRNNTNSALALLRKGVSYPYGIEVATPQVTPAFSVGAVPADWQPPPESDATLVGLLRLLDPRERRHRYAAGTIPPYTGVARVGELGALLAAPGEERIAVWITRDGRLGSDSYEPSPPELEARIAIRWVLAPARWRDLAPLRVRAGEIFRRTLDVLSALRRGRDRRRARDRDLPSQGEPVGYLHAAPADGRLPLFSWLHPVNGDQLLGTSEEKGVQLGYCTPTLVGFLQGSAPASGTLADSTPFIAWASRFGR
jgi:hypothetical protein